MARMTRAAVADQLDRPYVEMARLKGVPFSRIVLFHVMPNAVGPVVNAMALSLSYLMGGAIVVERSEEHTSELQSLMRISYAVFCLKKKKQNTMSIFHH